MTKQQHADVLKNQAYLEFIAINLASKSNFDKHGTPLTKDQIDELLESINKRTEELCNERNIGL